MHTPLEDFQRQEIERQKKEHAEAIAILNVRIVELEALVSKRDAEILKLKADAASNELPPDEVSGGG